MIDEVEDIRHIWLEEARAEARESNPLNGYCERVYFQRTSRKRRRGRNKGKARWRRTHEVELLKFLPSGRCVQVTDLRTHGLDALAEEVFAARNISIPADANPGQLFLEYFRKL
jgi:hypothetical protein